MPWISYITSPKQMRNFQTGLSVDQSYSLISSACVYVLEEVTHV